MGRMLPHKTRHFSIPVLIASRQPYRCEIASGLLADPGTSVHRTAFSEMRRLEKRRSKILCYTPSFCPGFAPHGAEARLKESTDAPRLTTLVAMYARVLALAGLVASASAFAPAALPTRAPRKRPASPRAIFARIGSPGCLPALRCEM